MSVLLIGSSTHKISHLVEGLYLVTLVDRLLDDFIFTDGGETQISTDCSYWCWCYLRGWLWIIPLLILSPPVLSPVMVKWISTTAIRAQAYDVPDSMLSTLTGWSHFNPPNNPIRKVPLLFPFHRWGNWSWGLEADTGCVGHKWYI